MVEWMGGGVNTDERVVVVRYCRMDDANVRIGVLGEELVLCNVADVWRACVRLVVGEMLMQEGFSLFWGVKEKSGVTVSRALLKLGEIVILMVHFTSAGHPYGIV